MLERLGAARATDKAVECAKDIFGVAASVVGCATSGYEDVFDVLFSNVFG